MERAKSSTRNCGAKEVTRGVVIVSRRVEGVQA